MYSENDSFVELFSAAQSNALSPRESTIIELRYGLTSGEPNTLEAIGLRFGVTRERIRQILSKSLRKIVAKGQREIKKDKITEPCAELLLYLRSAVIPENDGAIDRLIDFTENNLLYLPEKYSLPLIAYLTFPRKELDQVLVNARQIYHQRKLKKQKDSKRNSLSEKFRELLIYAKWFESSRTGYFFTPENLDRKRSVSKSGKGNAGEFHSNKMNRLVEYESELEHNFFQLLEQVDEVDFYQEQPFIIPYNYEGRQCLYYPDVLVVLRNGKALVVEIKPIFGMALSANLVKWSALKKFCIDKGLGLLVTDGTYTIQEIQKHEINPCYSKAVLDSLKTGKLSWSQYKKIKDEYTPSRRDFVALVLKNKLFWRLSPFMLSIPPDT
ncbi:sigma factor-like helix-turn-helix DNA-binding protein [Roseiflexus sp.]